MGYHAFRDAGFFDAHDHRISALERLCVCAGGMRRVECAMRVCGANFAVQCHATRNAVQRHTLRIASRAPLWLYKSIKALRCHAVCNKMRKGSRLKTGNQLLTLAGPCPEVLSSSTSGVTLFFAIVLSGLRSGL